MYKVHKSGGPAVSRSKDGSYSGACLREFSGGLIACVECMGGACHADRKNPRPIPDVAHTPDWCPYLAAMVRDAETMDRFAALGLDATKKKDALAIVRAMPEEHRPKNARALGLMQIHNAIRRAVDAGWTMEARR